MLLNLKDILGVAKKDSFAVGAFNTTDVALVRSVVEEAEKTDTPAILQFAPGEFNYATPYFFEYVIKRMENSRVPFALHLDHGKTIEECVKAIQAGFTSVMIDGSTMSFEDNIRITKHVVDVAHMAGVSVEGEIGTIGTMNNSDEGGVDNVVYTNPDDVVNFVDKTGVDALAVAIGTAHGIYPKNFKPELQIDILKEINKVTDIPLVLHGGSDNPDNEIREACEVGIQKVNISSDIKQEFFKAVTSILNDTGCFLPPKVFNPAIEATKKVVHNKMELFGSLGKAHLYR